MRPTLPFLSLIALLSGASASAIDLARLPAAADRPVDFIADIEPILAKSCYSCHGPEKQKGGLRLDRRAEALFGGDAYGPVVTPGDLTLSPLLTSVSGLDEDLEMPQKGDPLSSEQVGLIRAWIEQGANWPDDGSRLDDEDAPWSFAPLRPVAVPPGSDKESPIDRFLARTLSEQGLAFSPEADRRTLLRRLHLVLHGLPPAPEEIEAFVADADPLAYEKRVDRLLAEPALGERWAQHWLDVVRFAESNGSESNLYRVNAWPYRDYAIGAFNRDLPLDRFLREQIAGDVLGVDEATGFLVAGGFATADTVGREEQAIKQARADRLDEIVQGVGASMLGLTMSCARCHNHKFDPISQKDYYALSAVFAGVEFEPRPWATHPDADARALRAILRNEELERAREPWRAVRQSWTELWPTHALTHFPAVRTDAIRLRFPVGVGGVLDEIEVYGVATGDRDLALASAGARVETWRQHDDDVRSPAKLIDGSTRRFESWRIRIRDDPQEEAWTVVTLPGPTEIDRVGLGSDRETLRETAFLTGLPARAPERFAIDVRESSGTWREVALVDLNAEGRAPQPGVPPAELARLDTLAAASAAELPPLVFAGRFEAMPPATHLLGRGDPMSPREQVEPDALDVLKGDLGVTGAASDRARRVAFADWIADPGRNPLTPRVLANRIWTHVFGRGIVDTPGDFGNAGAPPSHPELLDWLAHDLVANGWSLKRSVRQLVLSRAFRQSSAPDEKALRIDADARLLWRFPPRRAEAEVIRDSILAVAGSLDRTMGGPGYRIHGERKRFESWKVVNNHGPSTWRRLIYQERMRGVDDRMFTVFDRPECGQVMPKRTLSTTPLQALNLLNGEFVLTQAEQLAARLHREAGSSVPAQVERAFALAFGRDPHADERAAAAALVERHGLPALSRTLFNANEFVFIE